MSSDGMAGEQEASGELSKELRLLDLFAIAAGAMFSSGFFLLPGLASQEAGPAVVLAYLVAGVVAVPAMVSVAELATAMPRAGGNYYFLDRSMGPLLGIIGGIGDWVSLVFKSAFALIGMSAYISFVVEVPIRPVALVLTLAFMIVNIVGVKSTTRLQVLLVAVLIGVLTYFALAGLAHLSGDVAGAAREFTPFLPNGSGSLFATVGLVFVSYSGLTKVASVSEEAADPGRTVPKAMFLALAVATVTYVVGVAIMVGVLDAEVFRGDLTPVATAGRVFLPQPLGTWLLVAAAVAAFMSTANAGMMSAARYPFAMARDGLLWGRFATVSRFSTPAVAVVATALAMLVAIAVLDVEAIAKLASAFLLLIFGLVNLAVIVMRESHIEAYDPGYRSPFYPWMQIAGIVISAVLVIEIGLLSIAFTLGLLAACTAYYLVYAKDRVSRDGAIYHVFERLGRRRDRGLDRELFGILQEQGVREEDRFEEVVARAKVLELDGRLDYDGAVTAAAEVVAESIGGESGEVAERFTMATHLPTTHATAGVVMPHLLLSGVDRPDMVIVRSAPGFRMDGAASAPGGAPVHALFFLTGDQARAGRLLRILGQLASQVEDETFLPRFLRAGTEQELKETLLADDRTLSLHITGADPTAELAGKPLRDLDLAEGCLVALIRRDGNTIVPRGSTTLRVGDRLTVIGDPEGIASLHARYGGPGRAGGEAGGV